MDVIEVIIALTNNSDESESPWKRPLWIFTSTRVCPPAANFIIIISSSSSNSSSSNSLVGYFVLRHINPFQWFNAGKVVVIVVVEYHLNVCKSFQSNKNIW